MEILYMSITAKQKKQIIIKFGKNEKDSGRSIVQVALLTERINQLQNHFSAHKKDYSGRRGLIKIISYRRKLLKYLKMNYLDQYHLIINKLSLRH